MTKHYLGEDETESRVPEIRSRFEEQMVSTPPSGLCEIPPSCSSLCNSEGVLPTILTTHTVTDQHLLGTHCVDQSPSNWGSLWVINYQPCNCFTKNQRGNMSIVNLKGWQNRGLGGGNSVPTK